jgi:hypothetical protein
MVNLLKRDEVLRRLPEINRIDGSLKRQTIQVFAEHCPDYFWTVPASANHHPSEHREERGLWLHSKRAFVAYERLAESMLEQGKIDEYELNCGRAAILLHDLFKYGRPPREEYVVDDHDVIAAEYLQEHTDLDRRVTSCVRTHNGSWYAGAPPANPLEQVHHLADMIASDPNARFAVIKPCEELREQFPGLEVVDDG